jgi:hypothetical protein
MSIRFKDRIDWTNNERRFTRTKTEMLTQFLKNLNKMLAPSIAVGGHTEKIIVLHEVSVIRIGLDMLNIQVRIPKINLSFFLSDFLALIYAVRDWPD